MPSLLYPSPFTHHQLPFDILTPILSCLADKQDLYACALVSRDFNKATTPLLYRTLDTRKLLGKPHHPHPAYALLQNPTLAQYVENVRETGSVHAAHPYITAPALRAISKCPNLRSITWVDDNLCNNNTPITILNSLLKIAHALSHALESFTVRTHSEIPEELWASIASLPELKRLNIWSMEGPPMLPILPESLTHLEIGGMPPQPTLLYPVLSHLPQLQELRLKSVPAETVSRVLQHLPNLHTLDTEYIVSSTPRPPLAPTVDFPSLKHLTVRTSSVDTTGPKGLWNWILDILPHPGLETLELNMFAVSGHAIVPGSFVMDIARRQGQTLKEFSVGDAVLGLGELGGLCMDVTGLVKVKGRVICRETAEITKAIEPAKNLQVLQMQIQWLSSKIESVISPPKSDTNTKRLMIMPAYDPINALADRATADIKDGHKSIHRHKSTHFHPPHAQPRSYAIPGGRYSPPRSAHPYSCPYTLPSIKYLKLDAKLETSRCLDRDLTNTFHKSPASSCPPSLASSAVSPKTPTWDILPQTPFWDEPFTNQWEVCTKGAAEIEVSTVVSPAADAVYPTWGTPRTPKWAVKPRFGKREARDMMLRFKGSKLREVAVWPHRYVGKWVLNETHKDEDSGEDCDMVVCDDAERKKMPVKDGWLKFVVKEKQTQEKWHT